LVHNCKKNLTTGNSNPDLGGGTDFTKIDAPSANLKAHPKLNTETRAPDSDFGGMATKARLDAASNLDAEFTPAAVMAIGVDKAVKTVKKCIDKICRIISLKKTEQSNWEIEYEYLTEEGFLEVFSEHERRYLDCYLRLNLFGNKSSLSHIDSENVSKKVRKYFPLPT